MCCRLKVVYVLLSVCVCSCRFFAHIVRGGRGRVPYPGSRVACHALTLKHIYLSGFI
jgi:hypothetical protein